VTEVVVTRRKLVPIRHPAS